MREQIYIIFKMHRSLGSDINFVGSLLFCYTNDCLQGFTRVLQVEKILHSRQISSSFLVVTIEPIYFPLRVRFNVPIKAAGLKWEHRWCPC